jgi:trans-aconitate methyltransferase
MPFRLYRDLTDWYRLVDPPADHLNEAGAYQAALERAVSPSPTTLLELGCGGGHNACFLKRRFTCTLTDLTPGMLALSQQLNPECEHVLGDMRSLRLGRTFDTVFVHDAVVYMTTVDDLAAAARTAFEHTRPGGAALFAPDYVRETFHEQAQLMRADDGAKSLRGVEWGWDPDPSDHTMQVDYALLLRDGDDVRVVHDRHVEGLFDRDTWVRVLASAGFDVEVTPRGVDDEGYSDEMFVCRRPPTSASAPADA